MENNKKMHVLRGVLYSLFAVYVLVMIYLLFLRRSNIYWGISYDEYYQRFTNFVPLKTLKSFYKVFVKYYGTGFTIVRVAFENLAGNVLLFVPIGIFLPSIWKKQKNFLIFLITVLFAVASIEGLQLLTRLGSCDIDDLLLNVSGAILGYLIWLIPPVRKHISVHKIEKSNNNDDI